MWTVINENFWTVDKMVYHGEKQTMSDLFDALEFATASEKSEWRGVATLLNDNNLVVAKFLY